jgi:hypothetical protein
MPATTPQSERLGSAEDGFRSLPDRYLGAEPGFDATYHIKLCDLGHSWEVRCTRHGARVRKGCTRRDPDVTLATDSDTWLRLRRGELSGIAAFQRRGELLGIAAFQRRRYRILFRVGAAEVGGLIEVVEWEEPRELAWTSVSRWSPGSCPATSCVRFSRSLQQLKRLIEHEELRERAAARRTARAA